MQRARAPRAGMDHLGSLEQTQFYELLVNSIQDYAIFLLDLNGVIATWNIGAQKLKGYMPQEIIGQHYSVFYLEADRKAGKPERKLEICKEFGHVEDEGWRVRKDGTRFWANAVITALRDGSGNLIGYAKITRDLSERKRHEDAMRLANDQLEKQRHQLELLNQAKDEFISLASHQLRTPASGVKQFLGLLIEGYAGDMSELQREFLERAYEGNSRQLELINDLLRVAQIDAGKVELHKTSEDIRSIVRDVVDEQHDAFKSRGQVVTIHGGGEPLIADLDKLRFRMALENLVSNASKYTPGGGTITVTVSSDGQEVRIAVADTGVGISKKSLNKLFAKFSRIPNELSDSVGGSGLGLYWAHRIIELHNGSIEVDSKPHKGSVFTIVIPLKG